MIPVPDALAIDVAGLTRSFGDKEVLAGVDLCLEPGGVFGLLGPNGAGKTTTVRVLTGVLQPHGAQRLSVLGCALPAQVDTLRPRIGVQTDTSLYDRLSALENLAYFGCLFGMERRRARQVGRALLERFELADRADERVGSYSKGMRQKVLIARALVADPALVFLDEPTAGLDPEACHELMRYIHGVSREEGRTFFITSHRLEEMESVCTRVGILAGGRVVVQGAPDEVARAVVPEVRVRITCAPGSAPDAATLAAADGVLSVALEDGGAVVRVPGRERIPSVVRQVAAMPLDLLGVAEEPPTLEEAYLRLIQHAQVSTREVDAP